MGSSPEAPLLPPQRGGEEAGRCRWWRGGASWAAATAEAGRLAALAAPMIAVALLQLMMQLISTVMVGHLGEVPLAGAAIANSLTNVSGFSVLVSLIECPPLLFLLLFFFFSKTKVKKSREVGWVTRHWIGLGCGPNLLNLVASLVMQAEVGCISCMGDGFHPLV